MKSWPVPKGTGANLFLPDAAISRQDMSTMVARAMTTGRSSFLAAESARLTAFTDAANIAAYAKDAMAFLVTNGILVGSGGRIDPMGQVSRAQGAVIGWRLYQMP